MSPRPALVHPMATGANSDEEDAIALPPPTGRNERPQAADQDDAASTQSESEDADADEPTKPALSVSEPLVSLPAVIPVVSPSGRRRGAKSLYLRTQWQRHRERQRRKSVGASTVPDKSSEPLTSSFLLYTSVAITVLLGPQIGWEVSQLNMRMFNHRADCSERPAPIGRCVVYPGHSEAQWVVAIIAWVLGATIGSLFCNAVANQRGRYFVIRGNAWLMVLGGILQTGAPTISWFTLGRLLNGIASGAGSTIASIYLSEIGPPSERASFVVAFQSAGCIGLVAISLVHFAVTDSPTSWRWIMTLPAVLGGLQLSLVKSFLVESPRWLLLQNRREEALEAFNDLYETGSFEDLELTIANEQMQQRGRQQEVVTATDESGADEEEASLVHSDTESLLGSEGKAKTKQKSQAHNSPSFWSLAFSPPCRCQFAISCVLCAGRQLGGVSAVFYYSSSIFERAGMADARLGNLGLSVVNTMVVMAVGASLAQLPRRRTLLVGIAGMLVCSVGMTYSLVNSSPATVLLTAMYVGFHSISLSPLPFLVASEVLPESIKAPGISVASAINWLANLLIGIGFPVAAQMLGDYVFVPFSFLLVSFWLSVYMLLPETQGQTTEQIQEAFEVQRTVARRSAGSKRVKPVLG